jgi:hypothetical protein
LGYHCKLVASSDSHLQRGVPLPHHRVRAVCGSQLNLCGPFRVYRVSTAAIVSALGMPKSVPSEV